MIEPGQTCSRLQQSDIRYGGPPTHHYDWYPGRLTPPEILQKLWSGGATPPIQCTFSNLGGMLQKKSGYFDNFTCQNTRMSLYFCKLSPPWSQKKSDQGGTPPPECCFLRFWGGIFSSNRWAFIISLICQSYDFCAVPLWYEICCIKDLMQHILCYLFIMPFSSENYYTRWCKT